MQAPIVAKTVYTRGYPKLPGLRDASVTMQPGAVTNESVVSFAGDRLFLFSAISRPGNSGGPVVSEDGYLVGLSIVDATGQYPANEAFSPHYAGIPAQVVVQAVKDRHPDGSRCDRAPHRARLRSSDRYRLRGGRVHGDGVAAVRHVGDPDCDSPAARGAVSTVVGDCGDLRRRPARGVRRGVLSTHPNGDPRRSRRVASGGLTQVVLEEGRPARGQETNAYHFEGLIKEATPFAEEAIRERDRQQDERAARRHRKKPRLVVDNQPANSRRRK